MNTYNELPYDSTPFTETHPANLAVLGRLFGLRTADPERCRLLELGCASGGNLIPMAWYLPHSRFLGIELSDSQAREGQALISRIGLENVQLRQGDILDLGDELGEFDFIIAQGVFSWVPRQVQDKILALCRRLLAPQGVAYISYNTLPGWRMRGMIRDMLLHHTRNLKEPSAKVQAARELLQDLDRVLEGFDALSARYVRHEAAYLLKSHPSYLFHEYLETLNQPLLFGEFAQRAIEHGLQYLCEADLQSMFPSALGDAAAQFIERFDDLLEQEQYLDFVRSRNFRQTLLCRTEVRLNRDITLDMLDELALFSTLSPPKKVDLRRNKSAPYTAPDGTRYPVTHPLTKAALAHLAQVFPDAVAFDALAAEARRLVGAAGGQIYLEQLDALRGEMFSLYANQAIGLSPYALRCSHAVSERPLASALARSQSEAGLGHLATVWHLTLQTDGFGRRLVSYLDGSRTREELVEKLVADILSGSLDIQGGIRSARGKLEAQVRGNCERLLSLFARYGILETE